MSNRSLCLILAMMFTGMLIVETALAQKAPELTTDSFPMWRQHILPADEDLAWQQIPWLTSYADGILAANQADKPLLLWAMNGHPLGCT